MHYLMVNVELAVAAITSPGKHATPSPTNWQEAQDSLRLRLLEQLFSIPDKHQMKLLTDQYQACIIRMMDQLYDFQLQHQEQHTEALILYRLLKELLRFLRTHYSPFFNFQRKAPQYLISQVKKSIQSCSKKVLQLLEQEPELQAAAPALTLSFQSWRQTASFCFADIRYAVFAVEQLAAFSDSLPQKAPLPALRSLLVSLNFNGPELVAFFTGQLHAALQEAISVPDKIRLLRLQLKEVRQVKVHPGKALKRTAPSLQQQLVNWLQDELQYYEQEPGQPPSAVPVQKIHTSLSVPQLAYLFRLLKEEKLITNQNQSELLKVVSSSFTTANKEQFSYGHLHGTFYKIEAHTKRTVYDLLIRLLHQTKKLD